MYTCETCKRAIDYDEAGSMNPETGEPICRRCVVLAKGGDPDFKAREYREKIDRIKRQRLPVMHMALGKAIKHRDERKAESCRREIVRLHELRADCERKLSGLET